MPKFVTTLYFDMRAPAFGSPGPELYQAAMGMAAFADEIGVDAIGLMEHHGSDDGYLPSPLVMAGSIAARTRHARISLGAVILPLHDPVRIAEDIAVLDQISNGRAEVIFGAGYVASEFAMFGVSLRDRAKLLDRGIELILRALRGERFETQGREVFVRPLPVQAPEDIIMIGGAVAASAKRGARFDLGFAPMDPGLFDLYEAECRQNGREPRRCHGPTSPLAIHLAEDVEEGWSEIMPHALHMARSYALWIAGRGGNSTSPLAGLLDEAAVRSSSMFAVWTPGELLTRAAAIESRGNLSFMPLIGGLSPEKGWKSLRLLGTVMPQLQKIRG